MSRYAESPVNQRRRRIAAIATVAFSMAMSPTVDASAADADEVLIRWIVTEDVSSIERRDDESAKLLESLSVVQLPADVPVIVTDRCLSDLGRAMAYPGRRTFGPSSTGPGRKPQPPRG